MFINRFQDTGQYKKELDILMRSFTWLKKVDSVIGCQGPVVVFTGTVHSCERFLMKQAAHTVAAGNFFLRIRIMIWLWSAAIFTGA